jgi:ribulose-5-phosphate 4-epimerase/fuculose-1-phosphate aldolase
MDQKYRMSLDQPSNAEQIVRIHLAACYRLCALNQWDDLIYTHISAAIPGEPDHYLINPFGMQFDEITASSLLKVNLQGELLPNQSGMVNPTGFAIHGAIHRARPDAQCVMHLHNTAGIAVSAQCDGLLPLSQHAMRFMGHLGYHDYEGLALTESEGTRLVAHLASHPAMLLRNHGTLTVGRTIAEAYVVMATLIKACEIQVAAQSSTNLLTPEPAIIQKAAAELHDGGAEEGMLEWPALLRKLDRIDPSYKQ